MTLHQGPYLMEADFDHDEVADFPQIVRTKRRQDAAPDVPARRG